MIGDLTKEVSIEVVHPTMKMTFGKVDDTKKTITVLVELKCTQKFPKPLIGAIVGMIADPASLTMTMLIMIVDHNVADFMTKTEMAIPADNTITKNLS